MKYENEGRVLLVDNERLVRFTISAWLKASHFEVTAVEDPKTAVKELETKSYDAVITDVMMDVVDGFMFRDTVRSFNKKIPFVFLTALVNSPSNNLLERVAADLYSYYAPKNSRREYLLDRLRQAIAPYRTEREAEMLKKQNETDLKIAARVQHALLPPYTQYWNGIFYSGLWRPHSIVSGDLFCWYPLSDHSAVVVFGDIAGHGTPAALGMTAVMAHLKELEHSEGVMTRRPELVCREIDRYIRNNLRDVTYVAGTVLFINMENHFVRYLNAGGLEPICFSRCDGSRLELNHDKRGNLPMGLMDGTEYTEDDVVEVEIPEDGLLCLYTDGFVDLTSDVAGEERMPRDVFHEVVGEFIRGSSGTSDVASIPYRLSAILRDMGYVYAQDDESFWLIGDPMSSAMRFLTSVPLNNANSINGVIDRASRWAAERGCSDGLLARLELLLLEHLENIRKHGLDDDGRRREVAILEIRPAGNGLEILVWDRGQAYEGDLSESAPHPDLTLDAQNDKLASSGRGLAIVRKICQCVTYDRFDTLNKFTFVLGEQES